MGIGKARDILGSFFHFVNQLSINQTLVPLGKENGWLDRIFLEFETGNLFCSEIPLKDLRIKGFGNDSDRD